MGNGQRNKVKMLLVDDNMEHRVLIRKNLRRGIRQFDIEEAESGTDCLDKIAHATFELILLDYSLPDISGLELLDLLRKQNVRVPIIMVTGQGSEQVVKEAIRLGASDYVVKTMDFSDHLLMVVERTLAQQDLRIQLDQSKQELLKRNEDLSILLDATTAVASQLDLDNVLSILSERIGKAVSCTFVKILLMSDSGNSLVVKTAYPLESLAWDPAVDCTFEIVPGSLIFSVISDNAPLLVHAEQILELDAAPALKRGLLGDLERIQSLLIMPITMLGDCLGMVVLGERRQWERSPFTLEKSGLAMALVQHAGIAIKNAYHYQLLKKTHLETIIGLAEALETRDAYTRHHGDRAVEYAAALAEELGLTAEQADRLQYAIILHDIGKIGVPDAVLNKPGKLTDEEYALMKTHPEKGANILSKIRFLDRIAPVIRHHHERWDGKGYPDGLVGEDVPVESRIVAILDSYDAMTSDRVYRKAPGKEHAINELRRCSGTQYDPRVVEAFLKVLACNDHAEAKAERAVCVSPAGIP